MGLEAAMQGTFSVVIITQNGRKGNTPNCLIDNPTLQDIVASLRMLPTVMHSAMKGTTCNDQGQQTGTATGYPASLSASGQADKGRILDEFGATTGCHRKYAIRLLNHGASHLFLRHSDATDKW